MTQHAELGASSAHRWMNCPGSVQMSRGLPNPPSEHSLEGTAAHIVAAKCLERGVNADFFAGDRLAVKHAPLPIEVDDEMVEAVQMYLDHVRSEWAPVMEGQHWQEHKFDLKSLKPVAPVWGTADHVLVDIVRKHLYVDDFKYGRGYVVSPVKNPQGLTYALGVVLSLPLKTEIENVTITIVQPRAPHPEGAIRSWTIPYIELIDFALEILAAAEATTQDNAPLVPGDHCRFCPAKGICPALKDKAMAVAQTEFGSTVLPDPRLLPVAEVAAILPKLALLEDWMRGVRAYVQGELEAGRPVPGYKLVAKRATRKWLDGAETVEELAGNEEFFTTPTLKSPAQVEKLYGKKAFAADLAGYVVKNSLGYNIAPDYDPRPAITAGPDTDFSPVGTVVQPEEE